MKFVDGNTQAISSSYKHGRDLIEEFKENNVRVIPEGMMMVSKLGVNRLYGFEVGKNFSIDKLKDSQLMYPIPGSCYIFGGGTPTETKMAETKTCLMRNCRLPTEEEYRKYIVSETV